jgi:hypothetical protein
MAYEKLILRFIWLILSAVCIAGIVIILTRDNDYQKLQCHISDITYPTSFNISEGGWKNCTCGSEFCVGVCYCVKMYSTIKKDYVLQNIAGEDKLQDPECTFKSIGIPFNLNFQPIVDKYLNKTIDCWEQKDMDNIYINNNGPYNPNVALTFCIVIFICVNMICLFIEYINHAYNGNSRIKDTKDIEIGVMPPMNR